MSAACLLYIYTSAHYPDASTVSYTIFNQVALYSLAQYLNVCCLLLISVNVFGSDNNCSRQLSKGAYLGSPLYPQKLPSQSRTLSGVILNLYLTYTELIPNLLPITPVLTPYQLP